MNIFLNFLYNYIHDLLWDLQEYKEGKLSLFWGIIWHYSQWAFALFFANCFVIGLLVMVVLYVQETWKFFVSLSLLLVMWIGIWYCAGVIYKGDRPTKEGINADEDMPKWLRRF